MLAKIAFGEDLPVKTSGLRFSDVVLSGLLLLFWFTSKNVIFKAVPILGESQENKKVFCTKLPVRFKIPRFDSSLIQRPKAALTS